jgi:tetratricopeptide (TPR) repeat protein
VLDSASALQRESEPASATLTVVPQGGAASAGAASGAVSAHGDITATLSHVGEQKPVTGPVGETSVSWLPQPRLPISELRRIFQELALGIQALHAARKLHCDIKPRNVMVAQDGRVVLLDFGLSSDRAEPSASELAGTPAYISPEQVLGQPASEASDWYAFGVMLYEALTGRRAFSQSRSLLDKASLERPAFPASDAVPEDLRELCLALLTHEPAARPDGRVVLERLGLAKAGAEARWEQAGQLLGRESHLESLREAWRALREGRTVVVHVHGLSGLGKTALSQRFFEELGRQERTVALSGRCYERESVPYKAFDTLVDSLTRHLRALPTREVEALVPPDAAELVRIFPMLRQVEAFAPFKPGRLEAVRDQAELRRRAFRAFKVLLVRLAERAPLALHLDDLQWADEDSIVALGELLEPPDAPKLLLVCGYRTGEGKAAGLLADHQRRATLAGDALRVREVEVGPLADADARRLAALLLGVEETAPQLERIAREAHGSPFFVEELVRYTRALGEQRPDAADVSLERLVQARVKQLPEDARRLLEVVAVAGQPVAQGQASRAAALRGDPHAPWTLLRSANLVRTRGAREDDVVECYHDRIRETVHTALAAEGLQGHHLRWATLLETSTSADPERLARHFRGGGVREKAGRYATQAAERAANALAFGRAAQLFGEALECLPEDVELKEKQADALVNAGRGAEAAPLYLEVARYVSPERALGLRQRAASQYLASGIIPEGVQVLRPLLTELGLSWPETPKKALLGLILRGILLQVGGLRFQERPETQIPPRELLKMDVAWGATKGLGSSDVMRGAYFSVRTLQLALAAGEPRRIARGMLGMGMSTLARGSAREVRSGERVVAQAEALCQRLGDPYMLGLASVIRGSSEMALGQWRRAHRLLLEGARLLEDNCNGVAWEYSQAHSCDVHCLTMLGELNEATQRGNRWLRVSEQNGDRFGKVWLELNLATALLAREGPEAAGRQVREALSGWHAEGFTSQHVYGMVSGARCELYRGAPAAAWKVFEDTWKKAEADHALAWQFVRVMATQLRAGTAVALAHEAGPAERKRLLEVARRDAQRMHKEGPHHARASAALVTAALADTEGRPERALEALEAAIRLYSEAEMALHVAVAQRRKGELLGGSEGQALVASADEAMRARSVNDPVRWTACYAPGFNAR